MNMLYELLEATWPVIVFLGMAYCAQGFYDPTPDEEWENINQQNQEK